MRLFPTPIRAALLLSALLAQTATPFASAQTAVSPAAPAAAPTATPATPAVSAPTVPATIAAPTTTEAAATAPAATITTAPATTTPAAATPAPSPVAAPATQNASALTSFFQGVQNYPSLVQSRLAVDAAQQQLDAANFLFSGTISASSTAYFSVDPVPNVCTTMPTLQYTVVCAPIPGSVQTLNATLRASPFNVGDVGARREQARLNLELSRIGYRAAVATIQAQAVVAAQRVNLAENSLKLAQQAVDASQMALRAAQTRLAGGGATQTDLQQAEIAAQQAQNALTQAQENAALAHATLQDLTGSPVAPNLEGLSLPATGKSASVQQAEVALARAQTVARQTSWNALPTAQLSYMHYNNGTTNTNGVGVSIDSKTLSPAVNITSAPQNPPLNRAHNQITLAGSFDFSANTWAGPAVAQNQVKQAEATLEATQRQSQLQLDGLTSAYQQAQRQLALSRQAGQLAQQQAADAIKRRDIGLISPLEAAQAQVNAYQAQLNVDQALLGLSDAVSKFYTFFAQPLSQ